MNRSHWTLLSIWAVPVLTILAGCSSGDNDVAAPAAESVVAEPPVATDDVRPIDRVENAQSLAGEDKELVEELLEDSWVAEVDGTLVAEVKHGDGHSFVTFEYETNHNTNDFRFDHDGCGIQPDVVIGVRFLVKATNARPGVPWAAKSFTWRTESQELVSCVVPPPAVEQATD